VAASALRKYLSGLSRNSFLLALSSLFGDISTEMLYPVLPVFLTQMLNASGSIIGLIDGLAQATQNIAQGISGTVSDRLGKRKVLALAGFLVAAIAKPLMGLSPIWQGVLGARLLDRAGAGTRSAPRDALLAASVADKDRGKAFGLEGFGDNAGAFLGPLLALALLSLTHVGLRTIFYLALIPGLLAFLVVLPVTERPVDMAAKSRIDVSPRQLPKLYWKYLLATAMFALGNSSTGFLILRTKDAGATLQTTILIYAAFNLVAALASYPAGALSDTWGRRNILLASFIVFAIAYLGMALAQNAFMVAALFAFYGLHQGIFRAVGRAFASDFVPEPLRASGVGWYSASLGLLQLVASLVAGALWDLVGHAAPFYYGAFFAVLGSAGLLLLVPRDGRSSA
jgi:MFS family permease